VLKIDKYNLPDTSIKSTEKYTIAEFEPREFRLEKLAIRLSSKVHTYFILYDYKGTISTDNGEVLELLKEKHPSGDCEIYSSEDDFYGDNLTIYYDEILAYQSDGSYKTIKYIPKWNTVYQKLAKILLNLKNPLEKEIFIGNILYEKCFQDEAFKNKNEWIEKFFPKWNVESLDPIHVFASLNSNKISYQNRIDRINILFRLLDNNSEKYSDIDFKGCPAPTTIHMIGARDEKDQEQVWDCFFKVFDHEQDLDIDFEVVKSWYGLDIGSFTIFLFWIDFKNFIPLDKYTIALLEKYQKMNNFPKKYEEYNDLIVKKNTNLYCNLALIAYDSSQQNLLSKSERDELEEYLVGKNRGDVHFDATVIIPSINNENFDEQQLVKDVVVNVESTGYRTNEASGSITIYSSNSDLKLISLKPLKDCSKDCVNDFLKILKEDEIYIFDKAYDIQSDDRIELKQDISLSLYDIEDLKINIHAIVGKNGTGKSTLVELLFAIINNVAYKKNINKELIYIPCLKAELIYEHIELYKIIVNDDNVAIFQYEKKENCYINPLWIDIDKFDFNNLFCKPQVNPI
jgi:hypothetical protein